MRPRPRRSRAPFALAACAAMALLVVGAGCSRDDGPTETSDNGPRVPASLDLDTLVAIPGAAGAAREAERLVQTQLGGAARTEVATANVLLGIYREVPWPDPDGLCWEFSLVLETLETVYRACLSGGGYEWTTRMNGQFPGGPVYDNWVSSRISTSADERAGAVKQYTTQGSVEAFSLTFRRYERGRAGQWTMLQGVSEPSDSIRVPRYPDRADSLLLWRARAKHLRAEIRADSARAGGRMVQEEWNETTQRWWTHYVIRWTRQGHGSLVENDSAGRPIRDQSW